jgi:hypothetical protein
MVTTIKIMFNVLLSRVNEIPNALQMITQAVTFLLLSVRVALPLANGSGLFEGRLRPLAFLMRNESSLSASRSESQTAAAFTRSSHVIPYDSTSSLSLPPFSALLIVSYGDVLPPLSEESLFFVI